jgi:hypothetical protein
MPEINTTATPLLDNWLRKERAERFEQLTPAEIAQENLVPYVVAGITFYAPAPVPCPLSPVCPACEDGDHSFSSICEADYKCACACHANSGQRKPAARALDYERLGYELAIAPSKEAA